MTVINDPADPWGDRYVESLQALRPRDAVRDHLESLERSCEVTRWFRKVREPNVLEVTAENVVAALKRAGIRCVLMGTHGLVGYRSQSRATDDVDVLVTKREVRKAVRTLDEAFPYLEVIDLSAVTRFHNPLTQKVVIDVMKPGSRTMQAVFRNSIAIGKSHRIPELEMMLALKLAAMKAPNRSQAKRQVDLGDFIDVVVHNRKTLDVEKLKRLAKVTYPGGGSLVVQLVADIDAGRIIHL